MDVRSPTYSSKPKTLSQFSPLAHCPAIAITNNLGRQTEFSRDLIDALML